VYHVERSIEEFRDRPEVFLDETKSRIGLD